MKRYLCLILVVLMVVPVLAICASAAEVYDFYFMERPAMLDTAFDPSYNGELWLYDGFLPEGNYMFQLYIEDVLMWATLDTFLLKYQVEEGTLYCDFGSVSGHVYNNGEMTSGVSSFSLSLIAADEGDGPFSLLFVDGQAVFNDDRYFRMIYVGDLPASGGLGLSTFLESFISGLDPYSTSNLVKIVVAGLILSCSPLLAWFGYRFLKRKVTKSVFKGRL